MKNRLFLSTAILFIFPFFVNAQYEDFENSNDSSNLMNNDINYEIERMTLGVGIGYDYGGLGGNVSAYLTNSFGPCAALGYNRGGVGISGGLKYRILPKDHKPSFRPYLLAMYGYDG
jgi:hypothetical protein